MTTQYADRDQLYRSAVEALGREEADTLMASLPPVDWSEIATKSDLVLLKSDLVLLKSDLGAFEERMDLRLESLELRIGATVDRALRHQTQWVFGAVVVQAAAVILALAR